MYVVVRVEVMKATERKEAILKMLPDAKLLRRHAGRYEVEVDGKRCLLVVNAVHGTAQFAADSGDADANVSSLDGVDYCLMATGEDVDSLSAWLVPVPRLLKHIKTQHKTWLAAKPGRSRDNTMRTVKPLDVHFADCKFDLKPTIHGDAGIMDRIKVMLSEHMRVRPDQLEVDVRIKL